MPFHYLGKSMDYKKVIKERAVPLKNLDDLEPLIEKIKGKQVVMLGESSHGTHEFYEWRKRISLELIEHHGFDFIAVEGDWPPSQKLNQFLKPDNSEDAEKVLMAFDRWPTWMWRNSEVAELARNLKKIAKKKNIGFYGLDVYSLFESMDEVIRALWKIDPESARSASRLYSCFDPYHNDEKEYARSLFYVPEGCQEEVLEVLKKTLSQRVNDAHEKGILLDAIQNAKIVKNAENYYQAMISMNENSWNVRDRHMMETLRTLLESHGKDSKGIVWAHNTHIGDYRATDMVLQGDINLGGLAREELGAENVSLIGFGTYSGTVIASHAWDGPIEVINIPEAREGSVESLFHEMVPEVKSSDYYLLFDELNKPSSQEYLGHRAIGVVYQPHYERRGNYVPTSLEHRYDAFIFMDETSALSPLGGDFDHNKFPESYPFGNRV